MYTLAIVLHVMVAILGVGQVGAVAIAATSVRRAGISLPPGGGPLAPLLRWTRVSLGLVVLTGIAMNVLVRGAYQGAWWLRLSFLLTVVVFLLVRGAGSALREGAWPRVERYAWAACGVVAAIAALMEAKPF